MHQKPVTTSFNYKFNNINGKKKQKQINTGSNSMWNTKCAIKSWTERLTSPIKYKKKNRKKIRNGSFNIQNFTK